MPKGRVAATENAMLRFVARRFDRAAQFVGNSSRHADKSAIRRCDDRDFEAGVRRSFHGSEIFRSKIHVSAGNRRASLVSGRYWRARFRSTKSFSFQQTDGPINSATKTETHFLSEGTSCIRCPQNGCPFQIAPSDGDLEVCALDYDGIVHALVFPCHKDGTQWVNASNRKHVDIQPTHWRKWTEGY